MTDAEVAEMDANQRKWHPSWYWKPQVIESGTPSVEPTKFLQPTPFISKFRTRHRAR